MSETTSAKKLIPSVLVLGLAVALAGCSTNSPTAPKAQPTPGAATVNLTASPSSVTVGFAVQLTAHVTRGGSSVPDGTSVTFVITGCVPLGATTPFFENSTCEVTKSTSGGTAVTAMSSTVPGSFEIRAAVPNAEGSTVVQFKPRPGDVVQPPPAAPMVYNVSPNQGFSQGGDQITITGLYLCSSYNPDGTCAAPGIVNFTSPGGDHLAQVPSYTAGSPYDQLVVIVPAAQIDPLGADFLADIKVDNKVGTYTAAAAYKYLADQPTPELYALSPNSGPIEGGTRVTLTGKGFQNPVQVLFADRQAQVVSVNFNQIIAISPSITVTQPETPTTVDVTVKNVTSGKVSNAQQFRYGEAMFISSMSPSEGPANQETVVTIYGQGFAAPLNVTVNVAGGLTAQVLSVAGTQIQARFPVLPTSARSCADTAGTVTVTNVNSNLFATSTSSFTYRATHPLITSVTVDNTGQNFVNQYKPPACGTEPWTSHTIHIDGSGFEQRANGQSAMTVNFAGISPVPTNWVSESEVTAVLPDLSSITLNTATCVDGSGNVGSRDLDTPVSVTINNLDNSCSDTLPGGLVIHPCDTTCRLVPSIASVTPNTGSVSGGLGVAITGVNFTCPATAVLFGANPAAVVSCSPTLLSVTSPAAGQAGPVAVIAQFGAVITNSQNYTYTAVLGINPAPTNGTVTGTGGINCGTGGTTCSATEQTALVTLTATPDLTYAVGTWGGDCSACSGTSCNVTMNADPKTCSVTFVSAP